MSAIHKDAQFVVDVKSTGLFVTDPVLQKQGARVAYWKTGHSYMKRRTHEMGALAGFEKSGHFFFNKPFGRGYDDGLVSAIAICEMLDRAPGKTMADLAPGLVDRMMGPQPDHDAPQLMHAVVSRMTDTTISRFVSRHVIAGEIYDGQESRNEVIVIAAASEFSMIEVSVSSSSRQDGSSSVSSRISTTWSRKFACRK
jgi:phosphomannomutase/phosphoglucomutase